MELHILLKKAQLTQRELADRLGIKQPSISGWRKRGIPIERVPDIERVTGIPRREIRPDMFGGES